MAISTDTPPRVLADGTIEVSPESTGWWMDRLTKRLHDQKRLCRLNELHGWYTGKPPLPPGVKDAEDAYQAVQAYSRTNLYALVCDAVLDRMRPIGVATSADADATGDAEAWRMWQRMGMDRIAGDVHQRMLALGRCPVIVGPPRAGSDYPVVTDEDPRQMVVEEDPVTKAPIAALKSYRDEIAGLDLTFLYRPGRIDVAAAEAKGKASSDIPRWNPRSWEVDAERSRDLPVGLMPVEDFPNGRGLAEPEAHLDLLGRVDFMILQRLVIATMQAFRQRAAKGLPEKDGQGNKINWAEIFSPAPGAMWALPPGVELQELGQVDLTPILSAVREDLKHIAAVTRTPMSMLDPGGENQSAEGANLAREGLVFKVGDRISRVTPRWGRVLSTAFMWMPDTIRMGTSDSGAPVDRADLDSIRVIWAPPERLSLTERASAGAQAAAAGVPWATRMRDVMGFAPDDVDRMRVERDDDQLFAAHVADAKATSAGQPSGTA